MNEKNIRMKITKRVLNALGICMAVAIIWVTVNCDTVSAAQGTTCAPIDVEICSICGNSYYNDSEFYNGTPCHHQKGQVYNAEECDPEDGSLCNICHSDFRYCPHHAGEEYGGSICTVWLKCNICGNNYEDGSVCPHHAGDLYGGEECTTYVIQMCNICDQDYEDGSMCPHIRGSWYDDGYCTTEDTEMCSICNRKYHGGGCPHYIGEWYDEQECQVIYICNICGNNYYDGSVCSHHIDEHYGGTVCESYAGRICNICGNDYDDGYWCSHHIGEEYNGTICTTEDVGFCNICKKKYHNGGCPHWEGQVYRNVAYFIYVPGWENEASIEKEVLKEFYGLSDSSVISVKVNNTMEFREAWNNIGTVGEELVYTIAVIIDSHGSNKILQGTDYFLISEDSMEKLPSKTMERLILFGCNTGHFDNREHNPAAYMSKKVYGAPVLASDGTVQSHIYNSSWFMQEVEYISLADDTFFEMCNSGQRDNKGWLIYTYLNNEVNISDSLGKTLTLCDMLEVTG